MILNIWLYFFGYIRCYIPTSCYERAVIVLYDLSVTPLRQCKTKHEVSYFDFKDNDKQRAVEALKMILDTDISIKECGFSQLLCKYRLRPGLFVGIIVIFLSLMISQRFLWKINFIGLENVSEETAIQTLRKHGIYVGCYIPSLDLRNIYNDILIDSDDFSWISVNIRGTVANVEVRENEHPENKTQTKGKCANLISGYDGVITEIKTFGGGDVVKVGDSIRTGELLVSGLYEDKMGRVLCGYAQGEVMARVNHEFHVEIPIEYEKKTYTGEKTMDFSLKIFSKTINIRNNSRKNDKFYDIIEENEQVCLFDKIMLPLYYHIVSYNEYEMLPARRTEDSAKMIAYKQLSSDILRTVGCGEILSVEYSECFEEDMLKLKADVCMNINIAKVQEFIYNKG